MRSITYLLAACVVLWGWGTAHALTLSAHPVAKNVYAFIGDTGMRTYQNEGMNANSGFVVTSEGVVVIDSLGTPSLAQAMLKRIRAVTRAPIKYAIVSHYHADHYYGLQVFKDAGAEIWAHEGAHGVIGSEAARLRFEQRKEVLAPWIADGLTVFLFVQYFKDEWYRLIAKLKNGFEFHAEIVTVCILAAFVSHI